MEKLIAMSFVAAVLVFAWTSVRGAIRTAQAELIRATRLRTPRRLQRRHSSKMSKWLPKCARGMARPV